MLTDTPPGSSFVHECTTPPLSAKARIPPLLDTSRHVVISPCVSNPYANPELFGAAMGERANGYSPLQNAGETSTYC